MHKGDFFGEQALLYNVPRTATITAVGDVKCVAISRENLNRVLGS
jgi:cGMP-dependent protein kinase